MPVLDLPVSTQLPELLDKRGERSWIPGKVFVVLKEELDPLGHGQRELNDPAVGKPPPEGGWEVNTADAV